VGREITYGCGALDTTSQVFDAEAVGAMRGLEAALVNSQGRVWVCVDSTSVIFGLRGNASLSSQWAFLRFHELVDTAGEGREVTIRWCPGHTGVHGNERADALAKEGASGDIKYVEEGNATMCGVRSQLRNRIRAVQLSWWSSKKVSQRYERWDLAYKVKASAELELPRSLLHRFLAMRHGHGDFAAYHNRFGHTDADTNCQHCEASTAPSHLVHCPRSRARWKSWPKAPRWTPNVRYRDKYLYQVLSDPENFARFVRETECF
jgi:ribonuclease HI